MEQDAFAGNAIKVRRLDPVGPVGAGVAVRPIVGDDEEDVGPRRGLSAQGDGSSGEKLTTIHSVQGNLE